MGKMYLLKSAIDENDGDYIFGTAIITQEELDMLNKYKDVEVSINEWVQEPVEWAMKDCEIFEITEEEVAVLSKFKLNVFGRAWDILDQLYDRISQGDFDDFEDANQAEE